METCGSLELAANKIGRVTTSGSFAEYTVPTACSNPFGIAAGPDGNLWFTERSGSQDRPQYTPAGSITEFAIPTANSGPLFIAAGPDGNSVVQKRT